MSLQNKYIDSNDFLTASAVYDDEDLLVKAPDGFYQSDGNYRQQLAGILGPTVICEECGIPCGGTIVPPGGTNGLYELAFSAGTSTGDTGAVLIHFNPASIPDGIRVLYDGVYYNRLMSPTDGNKQSTSGVANSFTILGNSANTCVPAAPDTRNYIFYDGFDATGWLVGTPSPQSVTIQTGDFVGGGVSEYSTLVLPKPNRLPGLITVQVLGPCDTTGWNLEVECQAPLPSFTGQARGATGINCGTTSETYYFAQFRNGTNTYPVLNNFVFLDQNGVNRATDQNYLMDNNQVITVTNGVVSNIQTCVGP